MCKEAEQSQGREHQPSMLATMLAGGRVSNLMHSLNKPVVAGQWLYMRASWLITTYKLLMTKGHGWSFVNISRTT